MKYIKRGPDWVPKLGFGTFNLQGREAQGAVEFALDVGYRHFDTAQMYENEADIGQALGETEVDRDRLFLTTKVWGTNLDRQRFLPSVEQSLRDLKQDHVDLLLIHWPNENIPLEESLEQLQEAQAKQYTKLIGVSNFTVDLLEKTKALGAPIVCNQFEYHPFLNQDPLLETCRKMGLFVTAYSPIARGLVNNSSVIKKIAQRLKVKPTQVALRWLTQQDEVVAIPKSSKLMRIKQNFDIFNFELSADDMQAIHQLTKENKRLIDPEFAPRWD